MEQLNLNALERCIGRLEGKMDSVLGQLNKMNGAIISHEQRINLLESDNDRRKGVVAFVGAGAGLAVGIVWEIIKATLNK